MERALGGGGLCGQRRVLERRGQNSVHLLLTPHRSLEAACSLGLSFLPRSGPQPEARMDPEILGGGWAVGRERRGNLAF